MFKKHSTTFSYSRHSNEKQQEEARRMAEIKKLLEELVSDYGQSQTYHDIKKNPELKKIFIEIYGRPLKYHYQRDPR